MRSKDGVSHCLDGCGGWLPLCPVLHVFNYLMESAQCPARQVSFFLSYKLDKSRPRKGKMSCLKLRSKNNSNEKGQIVCGL